MTTCLHRKRALHGGLVGVCHSFRESDFWTLGSPVLRRRRACTKARYTPAEIAASLTVAASPSYEEAVSPGVVQWLMVV